MAAGSSSRFHSTEETMDIDKDEAARSSRFACINMHILVIAPADAANAVNDGSRDVATYERASSRSQFLRRRL